MPTCLHAPRTIIEPCSNRERRMPRRPPAQPPRRRATAPVPAAVTFPLPFTVLHPAITAIRGRIGDVVYKTYGRKIIVTRVPNFTGYVATSAQRTQRDRLREATAYAQRIYADPAAKAVYVAAAKKLGRQPFRLAVADFLRGEPRVESAPAREGCAPPVLLPWRVDYQILSAGFAAAIRSRHRVGEQRLLAFLPV